MLGTWSNAPTEDLKLNTIRSEEGDNATTEDLKFNRAESNIRYKNVSLIVTSIQSGPTSSPRVPVIINEINKSTCLIGSPTYLRRL